MRFVDLVFSRWSSCVIFTTLHDPFSLPIKISLPDCRAFGIWHVCRAIIAILCRILTNCLLIGLVMFDEYRFYFASRGYHDIMFIYLIKSTFICQHCAYLRVFREVCQMKGNANSKLTLILIMTGKTKHLMSVYNF